MDDIEQRRKNSFPDWATWAVIYDNGEQVRQKEFITSYEELDRQRLREFQMWRNDQLVLAIPFNEGQGGRLIWRRRVRQHRKLADNTFVMQDCFYVVGKRGAFVAVLFEDGVTVMDDNFKEGHAWYGDVEKVSGEE